MVASLTSLCVSVAVVLIGQAGSTSSTTMTDVAGHPAAITTAAGINAALFLWVLKSIASERRETSKKFRELYVHLDTHFVRRDTINSRVDGFQTTIEAKMDGIAKVLETQTKLIDTFVQSQERTLRTQGVLTERVDGLQKLMRGGTT